MEILGNDHSIGIFTGVKFDYKKHKWKYSLQLASRKRPTFSKALLDTELQAAYAREMKLVRIFGRDSNPKDKANRRNFTGEQLSELKGIRKTNIPGKRGVFGNYKLTYDEPPVKEFMMKHQYAIAESYGKRLTQIELKLAQKAFTKIQGIYLKHTQLVYLDVANYLAEEFFDNDIDLIRAGTPVKGKGKSFNQVIKYMRGANENAPSKSWMYNALGLFVDQHILKKEDEEVFHTYGNLPVSHRIKLLTVDNLDQKIHLIKEADEKKYRVRQLQTRIFEVQGKKREQTYDLSNVLVSTKKMLSNKLDQIETLLKTNEHKRNRQLNSIKKKIEQLAGEIDVLIVGE